MTPEQASRKARTLWVAGCCLGVAVYIVIGAGFGRFVYDHSCTKNQHDRVTEAQVAGWLWPVVVPIYAMTLAVPCPTTEEKTP